MSNKRSCSKSFRSLLNLFLIDGPIYEMLFWPKLYVDVTIVITVLNYNYTYFFVANVGFYYRVQLIFLKCCSEKLSFRNLIWVNKDENMIPQQISLIHRTMYFSQLLKTNFFSETIYSQTQPAFICSNSTIITIE